VEQERIPDRVNKPGLLLTSTMQLKIEIASKAARDRDGLSGESQNKRPDRRSGSDR
jgi:hypothetical protein